VVAVGRTEIAGSHFAKPIDVAHQDRLVEAVVLTEAIELILRQRHVLPARTAQCATSRAKAHLLNLHHCPLQWSTGNQSGNDEHDDRDANQRRWNQQQSAEKIITHAGCRVPCRISMSTCCQYCVYAVSNRGEKFIIFQQHCPSTGQKTGFEHTRFPLKNEVESLLPPRSRSRNP